MKKFLSFVSREASDFKILLRNIPSLTVSIFILSVVCANLMANKELVTFKYAALDCGFAFSWIMFLCMDVICKRWGAKASIKISLVALAANLFICVSFALLAKTPGKWGEYYASENSLLNCAIGSLFKSDGFFSFASRSYISTAIAQLVDNFIFATIVSKVFFGWTWIQVFVCSAIGAGFELLGEVFFSGLGYKVVRQWEKERVGQEYIEYKKANAK